MRRAAIVLASVAGCYSNAAATRDVNAAWQGRTSTNAGLHPGVTTGASYAFVKVGTLAVDLRLDLSAGTSVAFGTVGVGVNLN